MKLLQQQVRLWVQQGCVRQLDLQLANYLTGNTGPPVLWLACLLLSMYVGAGHVCLPLQGLRSSRPLTLSPQQWNQLLDLVEGVDTNWQPVFHQTDLVTVVESHVAINWQFSATVTTPLVLWHQRLYLLRYWRDEVQLGLRLGQLAKLHPQPQLAGLMTRHEGRNYQHLWQHLKEWRACLEAPQVVNKLLAHLHCRYPERIDLANLQQQLLQFSSAEQLARLDQIVPMALCLDEQTAVIALAAERQLSIITGGPGTGKTATVTRLLTLLIRLHDGSSDGMHGPLRIVLAAPTGKAAVRLTEAVQVAQQNLQLPARIVSQMPHQAITLHRLLGINWRGQPAYHSTRSLPLDLLLVDEASMIDLPLMANLLRALPDHARVIFLGDPNQLAAVEAGSVLSDICQLAELTNWSYANIERLAQLLGSSCETLTDVFGACSENQINPIRQSLGQLRKSYRFNSDSGIGQAALAVNGGHSNVLLQLLQQGYDDLAGLVEVKSDPVDLQQHYHRMLQLAVMGYSAYLKLAVKPGNGQHRHLCLHQFEQFRILTATRQAYWGANGLNQSITLALQQAGLVHPIADQPYIGQPLMINTNDARLGLYNGDIGLVLPCADSYPAYQAYFMMPDGCLQGFMPSQLPAHETCYAMTVHKAQGSEYQRGLLVLPPQHQSLISRELVYTGITRFRQQLTLCTTAEVLQKAVASPTVRYSGLLSILNTL
jgi:exodeoxyribonuclease V alpha subunit